MYQKWYFKETLFVFFDILFTEIYTKNKGLIISKLARKPTGSRRKAYKATGEPRRSACTQCEARIFRIGSMVPYMLSGSACWFLWIIRTNRPLFFVYLPSGSFSKSKYIFYSLYNPPKDREYKPPAAAECKRAGYVCVFFNVLKSYLITVCTVLCTISPRNHAGNDCWNFQKAI